jgi:hypothetical protein
MLAMCPNCENHMVFNKPCLVCDHVPYNNEGGKNKECPCNYCTDKREEK